MNKKYNSIFERLLWGNFDSFHQRISQNNENINKVIKIFNNLSTSTEEYIKAINIQKIKSSFDSLNKNSILYKSIFLFLNSLEMQINQFHLGIKIIKEQLSELIKSSKIDELKYESILYNELKKSKDEYFDSKSNLNKFKTKYHKLMNQAIASLSSENKFQNTILNLKKYFDKYNNYVEITKNKRITYINSQKNILNFYLDNEKNEGNIIIRVLKDYIDQQNIQSYALRNWLIDNQSTSMKFKIYNEFDTIANSLDKNNIKNEEIINYIEYDIKKDFNIYKSPDSYQNYIDSISKLRNSIDNKLFSSINLDTEIEKKKLGEIITKIFSKDNLNNNDEDTISNICNSIKFDDTSTHLYFLEMITILRSNGKFCKTKRIIKTLGNIFNDILLNAELNNNYKLAQKCILLSQTYYYLENNNKTYINIFIQKNKWLRNPDFWRNHIANGLKEEILTFNEKNPIIAKEKNKKNKYSEIIFSSLITGFNNMKYFLLEKRVAKKLVNEFIFKFNLDKQYIPSIYNILK